MVVGLCEALRLVGSQLVGVVDSGKNVNLMKKSSHGHVK